jgi:hypothetical protein
VERTEAAQFNGPSALELLPNHMKERIHHLPNFGLRRSGLKRGPLHKILLGHVTH